MPANATLQFTPLTNELVWFTTVQSFNQFMAACYITITNLNLPAATTTELGAVFKANTVAYEPDAPEATTYLTISNDEGDHQVVSKDSFDELRTRFDALEASYVSLRAKLALAGITVD